MELPSRDEKRAVGKRMLNTLSICVSESEDSGYKGSGYPPYC